MEGTALEISPMTEFGWLVADDQGVKVLFFGKGVASGNVQESFLVVYIASTD